MGAAGLDVLHGRRGARGVERVRPEQRRTAAPGGCLLVRRLHRRDPRHHISSPVRRAAGHSLMQHTQDKKDGAVGPKVCD